MSYKIHFQELEQGVYRVILKDRELLRIVLPDYPLSRGDWPPINTSPSENFNWDDSETWDDNLFWSE